MVWKLAILQTSVSRTVKLPQKLRVNICVIEPQISSTQGLLESPEEQKRRFEIECEFVQALANPHYLNCEWEVVKMFFTLFEFSLYIVEVISPKKLKID